LRRVSDLVMKGYERIDGNDHFFLYISGQVASELTG